MQIRVNQLGNYGKLINTFDSLAQAAAAMGVNESSIRRAISRGGYSCGYMWRIAESSAGDEHRHGFPKILILDIETAPLKAWAWRLWKQDIFIDQIISDWMMLTWSAKWLFDSEIMSDRCTGDEVIDENDRRIIEGLWDLLDEADIVVAHNGDKFDIPKCNSRFLSHGMAPPSPYKQIDTKKVAKNQLGESSNKLEALARKFGFEGKIKVDFDLWKACMGGSNDALADMETYNRQDVSVLEEVYLRLLPYIKSHPNYGIYMDVNHPVCSSCGSAELIPGGYYYTFTGKYRTYQCSRCGSFSRERHSESPKNKNILTSIPGK